MSRKLLLLAVACLSLTSCRDSHVPTAPTAPAAASLSTAPTPTLDQDINALIDQLFPARLRPSVRLSWNAIKAEVAKNPTGKPTQKLKLALNTLVGFMRQNETQLTNLLGETREHALVRLVLDMLLYVYNGPNTPPPPMAPTTDVGLGTVSPTSTQPTTVTTPAKHAAVVFPVGAVTEQTTIIISQDNTPYPANCSGPLDTRRCQYPQFYKFNVFPDVRLNKPAKVAVCHVNAGTNRRPLPGANHDNFRLAHDRPANPADYTPGATQEDGVEILPLIHVDPTVMDCSHSSTYGLFMRTRPGALGAMIDRSRWAARLAVHKLGGLLTPKSVYAIDLGGGGEVMLFSGFADIDPGSLPDLRPASFTVQETELFAGETAHITAFSMTDAGTASAGPTTTRFKLSTDAIITSADPDLASVAQPAIVPLETTVGVPFEVVIPAGTAPGSYYVGMLADADGAQAESDKTNNYVAVPFTVKRLVTSTTVTCPRSVVYTGSAQTPCSVTVSAPDITLTPTPAYATNTDVGTATASYDYPGDATYAPSSGTNTFAITPAPTTTTVSCPASVPYTGDAQTPCTAATTGPGLEVTPTPTYTNNTNGGTATATASFPDGGNYLASSGSRTFEITGAPTSTVLTCPPSVTYTGAPQAPCSATTTGPGLTAVTTPTYTNDTNAGTASATASFAATPNHLASTDSQTFLITPAATTTTVSCPASVSYTGSAQTPCTATTTGPGLSATPPLVYANNTSPGTATATATFAAAGNHLGSTDSKTFAILVPAGSLTINPVSVEKLPGGTHTFSVTSGGPGPYTWTVNGVIGGNTTYGTITTGGAYTAPSAVPTPATLEVCATMQNPPQNTGCALVTIKPIPSTGGEVIVFNDVNMFDNTYGTPYPNNPQFYRNLVQFTATGARATQTGVLMHRGHGSRCGATECSPTSQSGFYNVLATAGFSITDENSASAAITAIPASIKVIFLWIPVTPYTNAEINILKQFAAEGGRLIFVGEHAGYYGQNGINTENAFFASMGAQMTNQGGAYDCGHVDLPGGSLRTHQITNGLTGLAIACASRVIPGPNDYPLFLDRTNTVVLAAVAKVDLTPLAVMAKAPPLGTLNRAPGTPLTNEAATAVYTGWSATPIPTP